MHRKRKPWNAFCMVNIASGMDRGRMRPTRTKLLSRYRAAILQLLSPPRTSLILDIHVMVNWHLSKQDRTIRWPVWRNNFVGSGLELIEVTRSMLNFTAAQLLVFDWIAGSSQINLLWPGGLFLGLTKSIYYFWYSALTHTCSSIKITSPWHFLVSLSIPMATSLTLEQGTFWRKVWCLSRYVMDCKPNELILQQTRRIWRSN